MSHGKNIIKAIIFVTAAAFQIPGYTQSHLDHGKIDMSKFPALIDGEIRKIDNETGRLTIRHGEIKHMNMPPMTMVFTAKDKAMTDLVKVGDKVEFMVIDEGGKMVVTEIKKKAR